MPTPNQQLSKKLSQTYARLALTENDMVIAAGDLTGIRAVIAAAYREGFNVGLVLTASPEDEQRMIQALNDDEMPDTSGVRE